jgi:cardiolipin synthase
MLKSRAWLNWFAELTGAPVKLLIQPGDGITSLVNGIDKAKKTVEIVIFRFDRVDLERVLENAVKRGVSVHALIAYTNSGGEKNLRKLEMRLLASGVTVARTADDLVRYHGKMMLVDRKELYLLAFNFTYLDMERCRSFGVVTRNRQLVQEAAKLFECDTKRQPYRAGCSKFLVSPLNARKQLASFIKGARKELLIYDLEITDQPMIRLLEDRVSAGVEIRVIGRMKRKIAGVAVRKLTHLPLHARIIVRDRHQMFIGSQSLRELELDTRRELGIIFRDSKVIRPVVKTFNADWGAATGPKHEAAIKPDAARTAKAAKKVAKRVTKTVTKNFPPVAPVLEQTVKQVMPPNTDLELDEKEVETTVRDAVKDAVKDAVRGIVEHTAAEQGTDKK